MSITLVRELTDELLVVGANLQTNVASRVTRWGLDMGTDRVTELSVTVEDPGLVVYRSGPLAKGSSVHWRDLDLVIAAVEVLPGEAVEAVRFDARTAGVQALKRDKGPKVWRDIAPHELVSQEAAAVGLSFFGEQTTAIRPQIMRAAPTGGSTVRYVVSPDLRTIQAAPTGVTTQEASEESTWDVFGRLAGEVGFLLFESAGTVVFARPTWLVDNAGTEDEVHTWRWPRPATLGATEHRLVTVPRCRDSDDSTAKTISADLYVDDAVDYRPGHAVQFDGIAGFEGLYIVTNVDIDPGASIATVDTATPVDPVPRPVAVPGAIPGIDFSGSFPPIDVSATATVERFVQLALAQAGDRYVWGAGRTSNPNPDSFDCSGLVYWAATQCGVSPVGGTAFSQWDSCRDAGRLMTVEQAVHTRGALLFYGDGTGANRDAITHVAISLGDGRTIEARGTSYGVGVFSADRGFAFGGLLPGLNYGGTTIPVEGPF